MESQSFSCKLESRPGQLLIDHLFNTSKDCAEQVKHTDFQFNPDIAPDVLCVVADLIGYTHDFGKATRFFQSYIHEIDDETRYSLKNDKKTQHGLLSSLFTYQIVSHYICSQNLQKEGLYKFLPIISFLVVKKHHGNLKNLKDEILSINPGINLEKMLVVKEQLESIDKQEFDTIAQNHSKIAITLTGFQEEVEGMMADTICRQEHKKRRRFLKNNIDAYLLFQFLYSALLSADKRDAAGIRTSDEKLPLASDLVDRYLVIKFVGTQEDNLINPIRNEIYQTICRSVDSLDIKDRILSINVPTGTGKTLTGFSFALKLREKLCVSESMVPRIIYCLPFLSVIEQNCSVFEDIFEVVLDRKPYSGEMIKHHHLAEMFYSDHQSEGEFPSDISKLLIEGWESEIVVTTFMQLFHTLLSNRNRMLRKFNAMANAIIILDEVQTIPCKYWHLVRNVFLRFSNIFNTRFILMTATQPFIFDHREIKELMPQDKKDRYLSRLDRITFINKSDVEMDIEKFIEVIKHDIETYTKDDFLIVLNTINNSMDVYNGLADFLNQSDSKDIKLYYLSTNIIPKHRLERIEGKHGIKRIKSRKIIVSTQIVEAGVDIDVDRVYRDFAPFDSINQVAGRCNRNFSENREKGVVTLFSLKNGSPYYKYIYGKDDQSILHTKAVLAGKKELTEEEFLKTGDIYFEKMAGDIYDISSDLIEHLEKLNFEKIDEFKLIDSQYPMEDVFIEIDETAAEVWQQYMDTIKEPDPIKRTGILDQLKRELYNYIVSVPVKHLPKNGDIESQMVYINNEQITSVYDTETGFIRKDPAQCVF